MKPAILVPYKNRQNYLDIFLDRVPRYLEDVNGIKNYIIYLAEQISSDIFNLALSRNVAARFALIDSVFDYFILHDVDIIPVYNIDYGPRDYNVAWFMNAGTCKIHIDAYIKANGYNPQFIGWGDEDKEFYHRLCSVNCEVKEWHKIEESWGAVVMNLEMPRMSESQALHWSKGYFGHDGNGPRFIPFSDQSHEVPLRRYDKSKDFLFSEYQQKNNEIFTKVYNMPLDEKLEYFRAHGMHQVDIAGISVKERVDKLVWLTYEPNEILISW